MIAPLESSAPDRAPPHSAEAEEHVIACCLLDAADEGHPTITRALDCGLKPDSFYFPANRLLFEIIAEVHAADRAPTLETIAEELKTRRQIEAVGGFAYLMQVTGKIPTTAHAGYFIEKVREKQILREAIKAHTAAVEEAYSFTGGLDEFLQVSRARVEAIGTNVAFAKRKDQLARLASRRVSVAHPQPEPTTRLFLADKPISTAGNITTLISKAKTGKTAALGAATAAIIAATTNTLDRDTFKFRASNPNGHAVLVIDTEQSLYDAYLCYRRSLTRAGTETDPAWLHHYSLVGYGPAQVKDTLTLAAETAAAAHHGIFAIILDGVADLVASVNDEAECNGLVTWLRALATQYDCPVICVIHSNEAEKSGDDGRGHLGKQLIRKAESNLLIRKSGDVSTITSDKQRKAPITEADGVAFQWSDEAGMHVLCEGPQKAKSGRKKLHAITDFMEIFPVPGAKPVTGAQLYRMAAQVAEIKPSTFKDLLTEASTKDGVLIRSFDAKTGYSYVRAI